MGYPLDKWIAMPPHSRLKRERKTVRKMIALYCHAQHGNPRGHLCPDCQSLADYADQRILHCPFNPSKPTCANCPVHCYRSDQREQIRQVMRFSGPRMLIYHPRLALLHLIDGLHKPPM